MPDALRIVQLNLAYDAALDSPGALLAAYHTLTGWSGAVARAGAWVRTVQRFSRDAHEGEPDHGFEFVAAGTAGTPSPWTVFDRLIASVQAARPDLVHVNGLMFPGMVRALRRRLPATAALALQDHSGALPRRQPWGLKQLVVRRWRRALAQADVCSFTSRELSERWRPHGLPPRVPIVEISPAASSIAPIPYEDAQAATGMRGAPAVLWVGRLDANKDPLTVLHGFAIACEQLPEARCWMVYGDRTLEDAVRRRVAASARLADRVTLVGAVPHDRLAAYFSGADVFVSGSHYEGSGYSLIEAMACGATPCVTDIPSFRALTGDCGRRWAAGEATACAAALVELAARDRAGERRRVRQRYDDALSWDVLGRRTVEAYRETVAHRRAGRRP